MYKLKTFFDVPTDDSKTESKERMSLQNWE